MTLPPQDLNRLMDLLQDPPFTIALVKGDQALNKDPNAPPPRYIGAEQDRRLIYYLLGYTTGPHEPYTGGIADHKGLKANIPKRFRMRRGFAHIFKLWRGDDGFLDRRGEYEGESSNDKFVPTLL